jgi:hypothetical protein
MRVPGLLRRLPAAGRLLSSQEPESAKIGINAYDATEPLDGGSPVRSVFFVAERDPKRAEAIVAAIMAPWSLPEAAVKALGLKPGDFTHG